MKNSGLKCDICGATASQSGKPFTPAGLGAHKAHLHGRAGADAASADASDEKGSLVCDICGANQNSRGDLFRTDSDVAQHQKKAHGITAKAGAAKEKAEKAPSRSRRAFLQEANHVKFCPQCGFNMEIVNAAMALVNGNSEA